MALDVFLCIAFGLVKDNSIAKNVIEGFVELQVQYYYIPHIHFQKMI